MISGATRGAGGAALGRHLASAEVNEHVMDGGSRGLIAEGIVDQVAELTRLGSHARTQQPLYHVHADPPPDRPWTDDERTRHWDLFEAEFGLERQPYASAIHVKAGRTHEHRTYLRTRADGTAIRLDHDYARREKVGRIMEWERSEPLVKGAHNRAVIHALEKDGRHDVAQAMRDAGLHEGPRPVASLKPPERQQEARTKVTKASVAAHVCAAWAASDNGTSFMAALAELGLRLAAGDRKGVSVIVDATGNVHALGRMLAMDAKANGGVPPRAQAISDRMAGTTLPTVEQAKQQAIPQPATPPNPARSIVPVADTPATDMPVPVMDGTAHSEASDPQALSQEQNAEQATHGNAGGGQSPSSGGGGAASRDAPVSGAAEDAGDGPGEPTGPNASPDETARYRARLAAWEERKAAAWARFIGSLQAAKRPTSPTSGGMGYAGQIESHGGQPGHAAAQALAYNWICAVREVPTAEAVPCPGIRGGSASTGSRAGTGSVGEAGGDHTGDAPANWQSVEPAARLDGTAAGRGSEPGARVGGRDSRSPHGAESGPGDAAPAGRDAVQALAAAARFRAAVAGASLDGLRAARAAIHMDPGQHRMSTIKGMLRDARDDLARQRAPEPHPEPMTRDPGHMGRLASQRLYEPLQAAQDALRSALSRHHAAQAAHRWWSPSSWKEVNRAASALAAAHAGLASAMPVPSDLERTRHHAVIQARRAARAHDEWQRGPGQASDRREHLLNGIARAVEAGDPVMLDAMQEGGLDAAMRLQAKLESLVKEVEGQAAARQESTVVAFHVRGRK